jgi:hypothetical protein
MTCPYYIDFTRDCIKTYPAIIQYKDFSSCESENYQKCLVYRILQSEFRCHYLQTCLNMFPEDIPEFFKLLNNDPAIYEFVTKPTYHYCLSKENHVQCVRYKMRQDGKEPPPGLSPEGQTVNINDSIFNRKIMFEQPPSD